jgi:ABC-type nitrate/sulfonate/bicarbonate transport system substrate-binding protein
LLAEAFSLVKFIIVSNERRLKVKISSISLALVLLFHFTSATELNAQSLEKVLITHSSDSVSITPLLYGIDKGFYRKEGIDLTFRVLRGELAVSSTVSGKDVDYLYGAGTAFFAGVRGLPMKIFSYDFKSVLFYLMGSPRIQSGQDLKGKKIAVASLSGTGAAATRASLRALGVDSDRDVTMIVIGAASVRMAAMDAGSVEAAIMPVPWNIRMKQNGFKELIFAGKVMSQPLTGLATSKEKAEKNPEQLKKMLRGFMRTMRAVRQDKAGVSEFIAKKFGLDGAAADETYKIMLQTMTEDGTVAESDLKDLLEQAKQETGIKREIALKDIVDFSLLRQVTKEMSR